MTIVNDSPQIIKSILIATFLGLIALTTATGNMVVLLAFHCDKKLRTVNDYFIMNMAVADFLVGFFCIPFYIPFSVKESWPFGRLFCKVWVTVDDVATMASVINIVAISINRYWSIAYPISYRKYAKQHFVYLVMGAIWFLSFINFAPGIWLISLFDKTESNQTDCSGDYNHSFAYMLIAQFNYFIWPFIVLCILNILIMLNIWRRSKKMAAFRAFQIPESAYDRSNASPKLPVENIKNVSLQRLYLSKLTDDERTSPLVERVSTHRQRILNESDRSPSTRREILKYKSSTPEQYTPVLERNRHPIKPFYVFKLPTETNTNSSKECLSSTTGVVLSKKFSNPNPSTTQFFRNDVINQDNYTSELQVPTPINENLRESSPIVRRDLRIKRDRKAARSLFILVIVFLIFLFPYVICATITTAGFHISKTVYEVSFWLLWLNSTCNPFLYPFIQIKYRRAYAKLFQSCFKHFNF